MDEVNCCEKIQNFKLLVENNDDEIALNYLTKHHWDEQEAAIAFTKENRTDIKEEANHIIDQPLIQQKEKEPLLEFPVIKLEKKAASFKTFFSGFFTKTIKNEDYYQTFAPLKETCKTYDNFLIQMKTRTGIIILYSVETITEISKLVNQISKDDSAFQLFTGGNIIFPAINQSEEGKIFVEQLQCTKFPSIFVIKLTKNHTHMALLGKLDTDFNLELIRAFILEVNDAYNLNCDKSSINNNLTKANIPKIQPPLKKPVPKINKRQESNFDYPFFGFPFNFAIPQQHVYGQRIINGNNNNNNINNDIFNNSNTNHNIINNSNNNTNNNGDSQQIDLNDPMLYENFGDDDYLYNQSNIPISNGDIIQQQKKDFEQLEKLEEETKNEEKRREELKKRELLIEQEKKNELQKLKDALPKEPDDSNPDKTKILFRYPDGQQNIERKFLKSDKVQLLYDFVDSLGKEIYTEPEYTQFILVQTTFPIKKCESKENTLEQEGLFPNAVIQIREIE